MGLFGTRVDHAKALRARRIRRLGEEAPAERAALFLGPVPSFGTLLAFAGSALACAALTALNHWTALGGTRGVLALSLASLLVGYVTALAARAFAPAIVKSGREAARAGGLIVATLLLIRAVHAFDLPHLAPVPLAGVIATIVWGVPFALAVGVPLVLAAGLLQALEGVPEASAATFTTGIGHAVSLLLAYVTACVLCQRITGRGTLIRAGFMAGAVMATSLLLVRAILKPRGFWDTTFPPPGSYDVVWCLLNGASVGFLAYELLPLIEHLTGAVTDIRLLELADLNRPILKKMSLEAPGTFHHSQVVARLAENAAEAIGANGLLARVGAYYHDLGKMAKPVYFTENNKESGRRHGALKPTLSALVIHAHVKDGIEVARELGLPEKIVAFIPEHHGTTACEYFYRQAAREAQEKGERIDKEVFRYPGPKPQSKETGIVHLADSCEAVTRSLAEPSASRITEVVREVVMDKLLDHQLDESPLTLGDLTLIQDAFVRTLTGIYHGRVKYPQKLQATAADERLARIAKMRRSEHAVPAAAPPSTEAKPGAPAEPKPPATTGGYEPPMTW